MTLQRTLISFGRNILVDKVSNWLPLFILFLFPIVFQELVSSKDPNLVTYKYHKNLKISVFGGPKQYLVLFVFGKWTLWENLVFFDLQIVF